MNIRLPQGLVDQHTQFTFRRKNLTAQDIIFGKTCHKNFPLRNSFPVIGDVDITIISFFSIRVRNFVALIKQQSIRPGFAIILAEHMPIWAALIITVLVTTVFGVLNGFLVSCCKIPPFVATMGTQYLAQGIGYIVSRVQTMRYPVVTSPDGWFKRVFYKSLNGFPMGVIYMVILFVIASFIFRYTKIGKYACAIGSNCEATRLSGVDTRRWTMLVYIIAGVFAGLAGIFYSATYTSVLPGSGSGMEMNAIAAVVIGGTSLSGGSGTMLGTIIGVFIMAVLKNGLMTIGIQQQWQVFFTGLAVLLAVMLDIYRSVKLKRS